MFGFFSRNRKFALEGGLNDTVLLAILDADGTLQALLQFLLRLRVGVDLAGLPRLGLEQFEELRVLP
jgi:hypothetical protein